VFKALVKILLSFCVTGHLNEWGAPLVGAASAAHWRALARPTASGNELDVNNDTVVVKCYQT